MAVFPAAVMAWSCSGAAAAETWRVPLHVPSIQAAIDLADDGDVIIDCLGV